MEHEKVYSRAANLAGRWDEMRAGGLAERLGFVKVGGKVDWTVVR